MSLKEIVKNTLRAGVFGVALGVAGFGCNQVREKLQMNDVTIEYQKNPPKLSEVKVSLYRDDYKMRFFGEYFGLKTLDTSRIHFMEKGSDVEKVYIDGHLGARLDGRVDRIGEYETTGRCVYKSGKEDCEWSWKTSKDISRIVDHQTHQKEFNEADKDFAQKRTEVKKYLQSKKFSKVLTKLLEKHDLR